MDRRHPQYPDFKRDFWEWFDLLPATKKKIFWHYKDDMAETNFFFTIWEKKHDKPMTDRERC